MDVINRTNSNNHFPNNRGTLLVDGNGNEPDFVSVDDQTNESKTKTVLGKEAGMPDKMGVKRGVGSKLTAMMNDVAGQFKDYEDMLDKSHGGSVDDFMKQVEEYVNAPNPDK